MAAEPAETLARWLAASARRDRIAFTNLYDATSAKLFAVALRILRREDWAEEVLQDSYVAIWHGAAGYRAELAQPMTWMTAIVRNRCLDWLRRPAIEVRMREDPEGDGADPLDGIPADGPGPLELLQSGTEARALAQCLRRLEPRPREAILLAYFEGLSHSELAVRMRAPLGTIKTWVRRGLAELRGCLAGTGG